MSFYLCVVYLYLYMAICNVSVSAFAVIQHLYMIILTMKCISSTAETLVHPLHVSKPSLISSSEQVETKAKNKE